MPGEPLGRLADPARSGQRDRDGSGGLPRGRGTDDDLDVPAEAGQEGQEPLRREAAQLGVLELRDMGLGDLEKAGGNLLGQAALGQDADSCCVAC